MKPERFELPIRIVVEDPIPGLAIALQRGHGSEIEGVAPVSRSTEAVTFDLEVTVAGRQPDGWPRLLGPMVQGPPGARFVYLCVGRYASQADSEWAGRVKVPLGGIVWEKIEGLAPGDRLAVRVPGRSHRGGPALATVRPLPPGWV